MAVRIDDLYPTLTTVVNKGIVTATDIFNNEIKFNLNVDIDLPRDSDKIPYSVIFYQEHEGISHALTKQGVYMRIRNGELLSAFSAKIPDSLIMEHSYEVIGSARVQNSIYSLVMDVLEPRLLHAVRQDWVLIQSYKLSEPIKVTIQPLAGQALAQKSNEVNGIYIVDEYAKRLNPEAVLL